MHSILYASTQRLSSGATLECEPWNVENEHLMSLSS